MATAATATYRLTAGRPMDANRKEADRWFRQGERDLESARNSCRSGDHEWACFQVQQSAEKVLKALLYARGHRKILTHSVFELIDEIARFEASFAALKVDANGLTASSRRGTRTASPGT